MLLLENGRGTDFARAYELARGTKSPAYYRRYRDQDTQVLPDAFGWQVITSEHLANATDLTGWQLTDLPGGRHLLQAPRLEEDSLSTTATAPTDSPSPPASSTTPEVGSAISSSGAVNADSIGSALIRRWWRAHSCR